MSTQKLKKSSIQESDIEIEDVGDNLMDEPFNPSEIKIDPKSPTLYNIITRLRANPPEIDLYPDFQRRDDLWDKGKQSRLIESILISFPLPAFYFDGSDDNNWLVVDGLQRLSSIRNFVIEKSLRLSSLEFLKELEGKTFDDLSRSLQRKIEETQIVAYIIKPGTPPKVKYNIFRRINTGGLVLEPQEIRHALNQGIPAQFVTQLASSKEFKDATEHKISAERMLDREFVTRFIAFYINVPELYTPDLDTFLNKAMGQISLLSAEQRQQLKIDFSNSMNLAKKIFGKWAFRKADLYPKKRKPINKALFEVWSVNLAKLNHEQRQNLIRKKHVVLKKFVDLMRDDEKFIRSISSGTGGKQEVLERFGKVEKLLKEIT